MNNVARAPRPVKRKAEPDILRENALREGKKIREQPFPPRAEMAIQLIFWLEPQQDRQRRSS